MSPSKVRNINSFSSLTKRAQISYDVVPCLIEHDSGHKHSSFKISDILDDLGCTEILNTDEQGVVETVPDTALLTISASSEEYETRYSQTEFKMPPEILDDIKLFFDLNIL